MAIPAPTAKNSAFKNHPKKSYAPKTTFME